jgi:cytochrome c553
MAATNHLSTAAVPSVPVPLLNPLPSPVNPPGPAPTVITTPGALAFDAEQKEYMSKPGETAANFTFNLTNISTAEVLVNRVTTSCGCTVAKLPEQPWHLAAGANGPINVTVDLRGKGGTIVKAVTVDSTAGVKSLMVKITIPPPEAIAAGNGPMDRTRNLALAQADRQAVFKNDCAECHVKPAVGKMGRELYAGACAICHDAEHRATMVPDLHVLKHPDSREYWTQITAQGKANSLMPAFAQKHGGILSEQQIVSLVDYLTTDFAKDTHPTPHAARTLLPPPGPRVMTIGATNAAATVPPGGFGLFPVIENNSTQK